MKNRPSSSRAEHATPVISLHYTLHTRARHAPKIQPTRIWWKTRTTEANLLVVPRKRDEEVKISLSWPTEYRGLW